MRSTTFLSFALVAITTFTIATPIAPEGVLVEGAEFEYRRQEAAAYVSSPPFPKSLETNNHAAQQHQLSQPHQLGQRQRKAQEKLIKLISQHHLEDQRTRKQLVLGQQQRRKQQVQL